MFVPKILNPVTGRWVKATGRIGQQLLKEKQRVKEQYLHQTGGNRKQWELRELEGLLEGERGKSMRFVLRNIDRILMTREELRTPEDNKFMHDYNDIISRYNYLIGKYMPEQQLSDINSAIYKYQAQIRRNPTISQTQLDKLITLRDIIQQQLGYSPNPSYAPLGTGSSQSGTHIQFQEDNDCPFELRPDTRQETWCKHLPGTFQAKTRRGFWCCLPEQPNRF